MVALATGEQFLPPRLSSGFFRTASLEAQSIRRELQNLLGDPFGRESWEKSIHAGCTEKWRSSFMAESKTVC